jgi:hypothetical protein
MLAYYPPFSPEHVELSWKREESTVLDAPYHARPGVRRDGCARTCYREHGLPHRSLCSLARARFEHSRACALSIAKSAGSRGKTDRFAYRFKKPE